MPRFVRRLDLLMIATALAISAFGLWIIRNATRHDVTGQPTYYYDRQFVYVVVGVIAMLVIALIPPRVMRKYHWLLYAFVLGATLGVFAIGSSVNGGQRWISVGPLQFQPSEFGKLLLIVSLAAFLAERRGVTSPGRLTLMALVYMALPALLVFAEPDFGTALVYSAVALTILFVLGAPWRHFAWMGLIFAVAMAMIFSILPSAGIQVLKPYQQSRLTSFLHPNRSDPQGNGYHLNQSMVAIGSGGVDGKGVAGATQTQLDYLPEHATDFIFSVVGEERGFIGAAWLIGLYMLLVWRGLRVITISRSTFGSLVAAGVVGMLLFQIFINIGMTIGIAPITGIPLPFMSYGGSHIVAELMAVGVLLSIHAHALEDSDPVRT
jgi:rod shape determining protein RodA